MADTRTELSELEQHAVQSCGETFQANVPNSGLKFHVELTDDQYQIIMTALSTVPTESLLYPNVLFTRVSNAVSTKNPENPGVKDVIVEYDPTDNSVSHAVVLARHFMPADLITPFVPIGPGNDVSFKPSEETEFMRENGKIARTSRQLDLMKTICQMWCGHCTDLLNITDVSSCSQPLYSCTRMSRSGTGSNASESAMVQCSLKVWCPFTITSETIRRIKAWSHNNINKVDFKIEIREDPTDPSSREAIVTARIIISTPDSRPPDWKMQRGGHRPSVKKIDFKFPTSAELAIRASKSARDAKIRQARGLV